MKQTSIPAFEAQMLLVKKDYSQINMSTHTHTHTHTVGAEGLLHDQHVHTQMMVVVVVVVGWWW